MTTQIKAAAVALAISIGMTGSVAAQTSELKIGNFLDVTSWDPALADIGFDGPYMSAVYDPLVTLDADGDIAAVLATDWEYSDDLLTLTMNLRSGITFSDGEIFDAEAAVASLEHLKSGARSGEAYLKVDSIMAVDADTIEIRLSERDDTMLYLMGLGRSYMMSPEAIISDTLTTGPVGSGPYTLEASVPGSEYHFSKKPGHWDEATYPYEAISIYPIIDHTARHNAMLSGQLNVAYAQPLNNDQATMAGWNIAEAPSGWVGLQILDHAGDRLAPLGELEVRQALNHAFDGAAILQAIGQGAGNVTNQVFPVGTPAYDAELDSMYVYNMEAAKALLAEAGYADGFSLNMPMSPIFAQWQPVVQQTFGELGIDVTWDDMQMPDYQINAPTYPMFIALIAVDNDPSANFARQVATSQWYNPDPDYTKFPEVNDLIETARLASPEDQLPIIRQVNQKLTELAWWSVWYQAANTYHSTADVSVTGVTGMMFPTLRFVQPN
jgi:peptide/nickel transport system substrate-binding protein|tara:strand:- start:85123 stop:86610 length:1488 start_codon:yes stop_codon:yes gene_type:complete